MKKQLVIDFEVVDYGINDGIGPGWPWGGVSVIHCGVKENDKPSRIVEDMDELIKLVNDADYVVAHNAQYEAGILHYLGVDLKDKTIYCTKLLAKMVDSNRLIYSLDSLAADYIGDTKTIGALFKAAHECHLIQIPEGFDELVKSDLKKDQNKVTNFKTRWKNLIYSNLDKLDSYSDVVKEYCIQDVELTYKLFNIFEKKVDRNVLNKFSRLINVCTAMRAKGVRVDMRRCYEVASFIRKRVTQLESELFTTYGYVNYNSPLQMRPWSMALGLDPYMKDGKPSYGKEWREMHRNEPVIKLLDEVTKYSKCTGFTDTIAKHEKNGRVHPELVIFQAKTGRFSSQNFNVQQIPSRDPILGPMIKSIFLPEEGEKWYDLDYSAQEIRLQIHYAAALGIDSAIELANKYMEDPKLDSHQFVCDMINSRSPVKITRSQAKAINLGISYGMGISKLANQLNLSEKEAKSIRDAYNKYVPYLKALFDQCVKAGETRGCIRTICGRNINIDKGFEYKAINCLIQGSAADQTTEALLAMYDKGIIPLFTVHDSICVSGDEKTAEIAKDIMLNAVPLNLPAGVDIGVGNSWGETKE